MLTPLGLELLDLEISRPLLHCRGTCELSNFKIKRLDRVKNVTTVYKLVIDNSHIVDIARDLRCDARNLYPHGPVSRPGGRHVVLPSQKDDQDGEERDHKRGKTLTKSDEEKWNCAARLDRNCRRCGRNLWLLTAGIWGDTFDEF